MSPENYRPPLAVHVFWSREGSMALRAHVGRALYEFLCRPLDANVAVNPGVGIPVRLGTHAAHVAAAVQETLARPPHAPGREDSCVIAIPLLDKESRIDPEFCAALDVLWTVGGDAQESRVCIRPVLLDASWSVPDRFDPCRAAAHAPEAEKGARAVEEVSARIGHFLMNRAVPGHHRGVPILVSHAVPQRAGTPSLAARLRAHLEGTALRAFFDVRDVARDRGLGPQLEAVQGQAVVLSLRTDAYSESAGCLDEVLTAKKFGVPIVCVHALEHRERRSLTYGGNACTYVSRASTDEPETITALCLQAWLHHLHFHHAAPGICRTRGVPFAPRFLSRPPELIDFAQSLLPRDAATLVVYPDPPVPQAELAVLRSAFPRVRLATPTTLHRGLLRRSAAPPLDGWRIALSLSGSPDIPGLTALASPQTPPEPRGLTDEHMDDAIDHLTLSLVGVGAELGYGGDLSKEGFTRALSELIEARKRTTKASRELLYNYLAAYLWDPVAAEEIQAQFIRIDARCGETGNAGVPPALQLSAMRRQMAAECRARVILGGKTKPRSSPDDKAGYSGRLPGQAEEAWHHLQAGKPLYVAGGFGGCAGFVARALCGEVAASPTESSAQRDNEFYRSFCAAFDGEAQRQGLALPAGLDALWAFFSARGAGLFHGGPVDEDQAWTNGLTVAENRRLFASTHPEEIGALVLLGLLRLRDEQPAGAGAPLHVTLYHGSIVTVPEVDSYAVLVLGGAPLRGADGALDAAMEGAIQRHLEQGNAAALVPIEGGRLPGDYVLLQKVGDFRELDSRKEGDPAEVGGERAWLLGRIADGMAELVRHARSHGLASLALVPFGTTLGLSVRDSVSALLTALDRAGAGRFLDTVALCEVDPERYREIVQLQEAIAADASPPHPLAGRVRFTELRPESGPIVAAAPRPPILLEVQRSGERLIVHAHAAGSGTAVPLEEKSIEWTEIMRLTHAFGAGQPPAFPLQPQLGARLADAVLPAHARAALAAHRGTPLEILHDREAAAIPFEMLCLTSPSDPRPHWPALEGGVRRCLLDRNLPRREGPRAPGLRRRLLLIADSLGDLPWAREEAGRIRAAFAGRGDVLIDLLIGPAEVTRERVLERIKARRYDILHFAGHAQFNARDPAQSGLILADRTLLRGQDLLDARLTNLPTLVVLNACEAGRVRDDTAPPAPEGPATCDASLAETIIAAGIQGFLGNLWKIKDQAAADFSVPFYRALAAGRTLGEATLEARHWLFQQGERDWLNYMLFGEAELRI